GHGRPELHRRLRRLHRRSAMDPCRCRARQARESIRRADRPRLSRLVIGRRDGDGARRDPAGCRDRAQLWIGQGSLHRAGQGRPARAHRGDAPGGRAAARRAAAAQAQLHAGDRRRGETRPRRRAPVPADRQTRYGVRAANFALRSTPMADDAPVAAESDIREQAAQHTLAANPLVGVRGQDILDSARFLLGQILSNPLAATQQYLTFLTELGRIATGASELPPEAKDGRFANPAWRESVASRSLAQSYLAWSNALHRFVDDAKIDKRDAERARFVLSLIVDAMAPTNSLAGNPAALKKLVDTGGASLAHGGGTVIGDLAHNGGPAAQVDTRSFAVGKNLATTPGAVVYRSPVMELIQYWPMGDAAHKRPLLIAPPQINKFYVFDLAPEKSIIQYCSKGN